MVAPSNPATAPSVASVSSIWMLVTLTSAAAVSQSIHPTQRYCERNDEYSSVAMLVVAASR